MLPVVPLLLSVLCLWTLGEAAVLRYEPHVAKPAFCNNLDCPKFIVLEKNSAYEVREYEVSSWVSTNIAGIDYSSATYQLFMRLFNYIQGNNDKKEKIAMTVPVITKIIPGQGPACESNFTTSFFLAPSLTTPPKPTDNTVFLNCMGKMRVYVRSFGGFANLNKYLSEAKNLAKALPKGTKYATGYYYTAGYDAPFKFLDRHNEIWFIAE